MLSKATIASRRRMMEAEAPGMKEKPYSYSSAKRTRRRKPCQKWAPLIALSTVAITAVLTVISFRSSAGADWRRLSRSSLLDEHQHKRHHGNTRGKHHAKAFAGNHKAKHEHHKSLLHEHATDGHDGNHKAKHGHHKQFEEHAADGHDWKRLTRSSKLDEHHEHKHHHGDTQGKHHAKAHGGNHNVKHKNHKSHHDSVTDGHNNGCYGADIHTISGQEQNPEGICINDPDLMPSVWKVPSDVELDFEDPGGQWTPEEEALAVEAVDKGLDELVRFFDNATEEQIVNLGTDAPNSVYDYVIASGNMKAFHKKALAVAIKVLKISTKDLVGEEDNTDCEDMYQKATFTGYAHRLSAEAPKDDELKTIRTKLVEVLNESVEECGSLDMVMADGVDEGASWREEMRSTDKSQDDAYGWNMWTHTLTNCLAIPDVVLPSDTEQFVSSAWKWFSAYGLPGYEDYKDEDDPRGSFLDMANLATHLQFIPTGYGRHYAYMKDAPYLYHYYRENFYASFKAGGHDLFSEFLDMLLTYGCTPHNDVQVRYGMRYMLKLYKDSGNSFVNWENRPEISDYDYIHKPWTGIASLQTRSCFEAEEPGSYGFAFRKAIREATPVI